MSSGVNGKRRFFGDLVREVVRESGPRVVAVRVGADQHDLGAVVGAADRLGRRDGAGPAADEDVTPGHVSGLACGGARASQASIGSKRSSPRGQRFTHSPQVRQWLSLTGSLRHTWRRTSIAMGQLNEQMPHCTQRCASGVTQAVARFAYFALSVLNQSTVPMIPILPDPGSTGARALRDTPPSPRASFPSAAGHRM